MIDSNGDYFCRASRKVYWKVYLFLFAFLGFVIASYVRGVPPSNSVLIGFGVTLAIGMKVTEAHRLVNSYRITDHHLLHRNGLFSRQVKKVLLSSVGDFKIIQTFWQRVFNVGDILVYHYGNESILRVVNIGRPGEFADFFQDKLLVAKGALGTH